MREESFALRVIVRLRLSRGVEPNPTPPNIWWLLRYFAWVVIVLALLIKTSTVASEPPSPACSQTPGSAPQLPLFLIEGGAVGSNVIRIGSLAGASDLSERVLRVTLVPAKGEAVVLNASFPPAVISMHQGRPIATLTVPVPHVAPGEYRILVEDKDISAPSGCNISFYVVLGTMRVNGATLPH